MRLIGFKRVLTLFSKSLPLDLVVHVWDVYMLEGESFIFRVALGILVVSYFFQLHEGVMQTFQNELRTADFDGCLGLLSNIPKVCGC